MPVFTLKDKSYANSHPEVRLGKLISDYDLRPRAHKLKLPLRMNEILSHGFFTKICIKSNQAVWWIQFLLVLNNVIDSSSVILVASPVSYDCLLLNYY